MVITPSQLPYPELGPADLVVITLDGELAGPAAPGRVPSSESQLHCACYQAFPEIGAVLHSHPPFATMFAAARQPVPAVVDEAVLFLGGDIPVARYAPSGSAQVGRNAVRVLADRASALLASHGMVTIAASPAQALHVRRGHRALRPGGLGHPGTRRARRAARQHGAGVRRQVPAGPAVS